MTGLQRFIEQKRQSKDILLMSHCVVGAFDQQTNEDSIAELVNAGIDLIELQFPFSEPVADGPVLALANQQAVETGITTSECFEFAQKICQQYQDTRFICMTYFNILYQYGLEAFIDRAAQIGIAGLIVCDLPPDNAEELIRYAASKDVSIILLVTPNTSKERIQYISHLANGMLYAVARYGVTGHQTLFTDEFYQYLDQVNASSNVPVGVGFGIQTKYDVEQLKGKADIAIVCTQVIKALQEGGLPQLKSYLTQLV